MQVSCDPVPLLLLIPKSLSCLSSHSPPPPILKSFFTAVEYSADEDSEIDYGYSEERTSSSGSDPPVRVTDLEASFGSFKGRTDQEALLFILY